MEQRSPLTIDRTLQSFALLIVLLLPALLAAWKPGIADADLGWHLRTGEWIYQHHAVPHSDLFSRFGAGRPWVAYSWLFELALFLLYHHFGLFGITLYTAGMVLAIQVALYSLARSLQSRFSIALVLSSAACLDLNHLYSPRPWLLSIFLFALLLHIVTRARLTGKNTVLAWLPVIFLFWSNMHIQFLDGLAVLAILWLESLTAGDPSRIPRRWLTVVCIACILATFCNPYGWRIYQAAYELTTQAGVVSRLNELSAPVFRDLTDWLALSLALAATALLAKAKKFPVFEAFLLGFGCYSAFRSSRDLWLLVIAALTILSARIKLEQPQSETSSEPKLVWPALAAIAFLIPVLRALGIGDARLRSQQAASMPVDATQFVLQKNLPGPVYNSYPWGGYLIWKLGQPVSIDGRAAFYGDERIAPSDATWTGKPGWSLNPELQTANLVIGPTDSALTQLLRMDSGFQLVYEDKLATVFVRKK